VDYTCPHCRAASAFSLRRIAAHPRELRIIRRHWPRTPCQPASETRCLPLRIALCADEQDRFWQADRWLFDHSRGGDVPDIATAARDLGLDGERLRACVGRASTFERAALEAKRAKKLRLPGVPYYAEGDRIATRATMSAWIDAL
jgi:protein-disulfide isomerase